MPRLDIKAVPGARRNEIAGWLGERLKIRISAPPEGGKANKAICALLAETLGLRPRNITIVSGPTSPEKTVEIVGLSDGDLAGRLPRKPSS